MRRRCLWPGCQLRLRDGVSAEIMYCIPHHTALGAERQERLRVSYGTPAWLAAIDEAQAFARDTNRWVKTKVTGGSNAHTDSPPG